MTTPIIDIWNLFVQINKDNVKLGKSVVPLISYNADYYVEQMKTLGFSEEDQDAFKDFLID